METGDGRSGDGPLPWTWLAVVSQHAARSIGLTAKQYFRHFENMVLALDLS
jgi:hypothetical protein